MSLEYGIKIKNIEASTLYEYNNGVREKYEYKNAMFTNSLLHDFLLQNGLKIKNESYTKDIICLEFNYGSRSYQEEKEHLYGLIHKYRKELNSLKSQKITKDILERINKVNLKRKRIIELYIKAKQNKNFYVKKSKEEIRKDFYQNGVYVTYITRNKNGSIRRSDMLHYKMLYRSTGKAKKGSCMFICDRLYNKAHNFLYMGLKLPKEDAPLVEIGAYSSLVASSIVDKIQIDPNNILVLKDLESFMRTKVLSVETDNDKHCIIKPYDDYELKNVAFDGQALIDSSIFPKWADGYILLRHHMCKMACFNSNIQDFFKDYYKQNYETAIVEDMFGKKHYVKDLKLITTESALKWLKFKGITYDYWCEKVKENNCMFGIVKTAHKSKLGNVQKMSYQMINSLNLDIMNNVVKESVDYINLMKKDDNVFLDYLRDNYNFSNDYEALVALCEQNSDFIKCDYFRQRKSDIIRGYINKFRFGKVIQNADNLVLCGSPYAMLLQSVGEDIENDDTLVVEDGTIQCYTNRFDDNEYLCGFRSPHNSQNNILYLHNIKSDKMDKYFNFGEQILAVNVRHTDVQDRGNGLDFDSDSCYTTNQADIVNHAKWCYLNKPTIVNNIPKDKNHYSNTLEEFANIDNNLAKQQLSIGTSSNLAQICQTYGYTFNDQKYQDYICILSVLAQVSIDSAKRSFDVNINDEITRIKKEVGVEENKYPLFWKYVNQDLDHKKINKSLICPMNHLCDIKFKEYKTNGVLPIQHFFAKVEEPKDRKTCRKVEELIEEYGLNYLDNGNCEDEDYLLARNDFDELIEEIRTIYISKNYITLMSWLINRAFDTNGRMKKSLSNLNKNKPLLMNTLYKINPKIFLKCFSKNAKK